MSRPPLEVADVVRQHGAAFLTRYGHTLSGTQHRALRAIAVCRTAALGGHITQCDHCDHEIQAYNSCLMGRIHLWGFNSLSSFNYRTELPFDST
jgi:Transposase zinc-binding domain